MLTINKWRTGQPVQVAPRSFISAMEIFKGLPAVAMAELERKMTEKKFSKGESIFLEGDPAESVWFVKEGHIKAQVCTPNGRCQTLCMVGARGMFGSCCAFGGGNYPCHSIAETDVTVMAFPMNEFINLMGRFPALALSMAHYLSKKLHQSKDMQTFEQESVERRILHVLAGLSEEFGNTIPLTRKEIAEMTGTVVETCIRTFAKLEAEGLVSSTRGKITIKSLPALTQRMREED